MKVTKKAVSVVLVSAMLLSAVSCGKNTRTKEPKLSGTVISEDDPWFDYEITSIKAGTDPDKELEYFGTSVAGVDDRYIVLLSQGNYMTPAEDERDWDTYNFRDYYMAEIEVIDRETKEVVNCIDLYDLVPRGSHIDTPVYSNGEISLKTAGFNMETRKNITKDLVIEPLTGKLIDTREEEGRYDYMSFGEVIGEYRIECVVNSTEDGYSSYNILKIRSSDGKIETVDMRDFGKDIDVYAVFPLSDTTVLLYANEGYKPAQYELDLKTTKLRKAGANEYKWLDDISTLDFFAGSDGMIYAPCSYGFSRVDIKEKTIEKIFDYNWSTLNQSETWCYEIIDCTENNIILAGNSSGMESFYGESHKKEINIIELTRADKNPHAGKTVLELYGDINSAVEEAISAFNESESEYFIKVSYRYDKYEYIDIDNVDLNNEDEFQKELLKVGKGISNELAMDIMNGDGPDILINTSEYSQLNNPNYLVDLSPYLGTLDPDIYFMNVIEGAKTDNVLYQVPVCFSVSGIATKSEYTGSTGTGFTFSEYEEFYHGPLNGKNIYYMSRTLLFAKLFSAMSELFIKNGKADLSGPEFAELADFTKENFDDNPVLLDELNSQPETVYEPEAIYLGVSGIGGYLQTDLEFKRDCAILGSPSVDGRGPLIKTVCSAAISAQALDIDACAEFVKILLSEEVQKRMAEDDKFVLNRKAFRETGKIAIDYYNNGGELCSNGNGISTYYGKFTTEDIDNAERIVLSCSRIESEDYAISMILIEEMPAYFLDQKDLDKVIKIAENRIQKVLDERDKGS